MRIAFIIIMLFSSIASDAADFAVSNVNEFNTVLSKVKAGDCIIWKDGTYNDVKIDFKLAEQGKDKQSIILKAQTPGKVTFKGSSRLIINGTYLQAEGFMFDGASTLEDGEDVVEFGAESKHCRITNCAVVNYVPANINTGYSYIMMKGSYNEVDHCYFTGKTNKAPVLVVAYYKDKDYVDGGDKAPSTYHHIHHNYFGYRTYPENGGEDMRIGDSKTSFTHGFNIIEYNYFEDERLEAEVISNKSWDNIYRFNTFSGNDGAMVLRHGQRCFVYGNYFNGSTGRGKSGGIRIINPNQTVFNNYLENLEGGNQSLKSPITIMSGLEGSALNEYYPADSALVAYNTIKNSVGPAIAAGVGNASKGKPFVSPKNISLVSNLVIGIKGKNAVAFIEKDNVTSLLCKANKYTDGDNVTVKGFDQIGMSKVLSKKDICYVDEVADKNVVEMINARLKVHNIELTDKQISHFNPDWILKKSDVGVDWMK